MTQNRLILCLIAASLAMNVASAQTAPSGDVINSDLRDLLRAASEDGWIEFVPDGKLLNVPDDQNKLQAVSKDTNCSVFVGIDQNGLFRENPISSDKLNDLLPKLLEGTPLTERELEHFFGLRKCGVEFAVWDYLATAQIDGQAVVADTAIASLDVQSDFIRQRAGLSLAIAAGLSGNRASLRRFTDMLEDAGLHGTKATERDPRHILLDALLLEKQNPDSARRRYEWLSERDGPEQLIALNRLTDIGAGTRAAHSMERLGQDPSLTGTSELVDLQLRTALKTGQLSMISNLLRSDAINPNDVTHENQVAIVDLIRTALSSDDVYEKISALDLFSQYGPFFKGQDLESLVETAFVSVLDNASEGVDPIESKNVVTPAKVLLPPLQEVNSETARQFISDISNDLVEAEKVLSDG